MEIKEFLLKIISWLFEKFLHMLLTSPRI